MQNWLYWQTQDQFHEDPHHWAPSRSAPCPPQINAAGIKDFACINNATRITEDKSTIPAKYPLAGPRPCL